MTELVSPCDSCAFNALIKKSDAAYEDNTEGKGCERMSKIIKDVYDTEVTCGFAAAAVLRFAGSDESQGMLSEAIVQILGYDPRVTS